MSKIPLALRRDILRREKERLGGKIIGSRLYPIAGSASMLVQETANACMVAGSWFVVNTEAKEESAVEKGLAGVGLVPYLPMEPREERHGRGSTRIVDYPVMAGYLFVKCRPTAEDWHKVVATRGVRCILGSAATRTPLAVSDDHIQIFRLVETERAEAEVKRQARLEAAARARAGGRSGIVWHFTQGDKVRVKQGPFAAFYGELTQAIDIHDRARILTTLFGRATYVELSAHDIEAV
jgi:transcription termination/antitermination protein NusG